MKIGLISINMYPKFLNLASTLHTYTMQEYLREQGIEAVIIDYKPTFYGEFDLKHPSDYYARQCQKYLESAGATTKEKQSNARKFETSMKSKEDYERVYDRREIRYEKQQAFIRKYYKKTEKCYDSDLLEVEDPGFDCYICATDVIWRYVSGVGFDRGFFLATSAMENKWKIAYSASRGVHVAKTEEEEREFFGYLEDFDFISVREKSLQEYIEEKSELRPRLVLDPVLMLDVSAYERMAIKPAEEHYLLLYYVMEKATDTIEQAARYARVHHLKIVELTDLPLDQGRLTAETDIEHVYRYETGIEEWLGYFQHAEVVFTNSFHACCLSILFEKDFYVGYRNGDKVSHIMSLFGLESRIVDAQTDLEAQPAPAIDYSQVRRILEENRKTSGEFLMNAIHSCEQAERVPKQDYEAYKKTLKYQMYYNSGKSGEGISWTWKRSGGHMNRNPSGTLEYIPRELTVNDGRHCFLRNAYQIGGYTFLGWQIRFKIDNRWFYYLEDGSVVLKSEYDKARDKARDPKRYLFADGDPIPYLPVYHIAALVAEAVWEKIGTDGTGAADMEQADSRKASGGENGSGADACGKSAAAGPDGAGGGAADSRENGGEKAEGGQQAGSNEIGIGVPGGESVDSNQIVSGEAGVEEDNGRAADPKQAGSGSEGTGCGKVGGEESGGGGPDGSEALDGSALREDGDVIPADEVRVVQLSDPEAYRKTLKYKLTYNGIKKTEVPDEVWKALNAKHKIQNNGESTFIDVRFNSGTRKKFAGWTLKFKVRKEWFYYLADGSIRRENGYQEGKDMPRAVFFAGQKIPVLPVNWIEAACADLVTRPTMKGRCVSFLKRHTSAQTRRKLRKIFS